MSSDIVELHPASDDDDPVIPFESGVPLLDADPAVIARRGKDKSWEFRANFFNNIVAGSLKALTLIMEKADEPDLSVGMAAGLLGMHQRIEETLDIWGEEDPTDINAAALYTLSLSPLHRKASNAFCRDNGSDGRSLSRLALFAEWQNLLIFYNLSDIARPGMTEVWHRDGKGCKCGNPEDVA